MSSEKEYVVEVVLENKPQALDPVGSTIQKDLWQKKDTIWYRKFALVNI